MDEEVYKATPTVSSSSSKKDPERRRSSGVHQESFTFVNFRPTSTTEKADAQRQIRSAATRWQHGNGPPKRARKPRSTVPLRALAPATGAHTDLRSHAVDTSNESAHLRLKETALTRQEGSREEDSYTEPGSEALEAVTEQMLNALTKLTSSPLERSFSRGTAAARVFLLNDATNSTGRALRHLRTDLVTVLVSLLLCEHKYTSRKELTNYGLSLQRCYEGLARFQGQSFVKDVKNQLKPDAPPVNVVHMYLQYVASDPAAVLAAVLISVHLLRISPNWAPQPNEEYHLLVLRQAVIAEINSALDDPLRRISSSVMVAVALLSAYEAHYGSIEGWHTHVAGLVRMIQMRGGLAEMGRESVYEELWFLWQIRNTSSIAKCEDYWVTVSRTSALRHPRANLEVFNAVDLKGKQTGQS